MTIQYTYLLLTYSMEHSPSCEANWFCSQSRNSPHFWSPKVPHRTHKRPPPVPILSQLHPVPTTPSHFLKIPLDIILPSTSGSPQWSFSLRFTNQNPVHTSTIPHTRYMPRPSHYSLFYHRTVLGEQYSAAQITMLSVYIYLVVHYSARGTF